MKYKIKKTKVLNYILKMNIKLNCGFLKDLYMFGFDLLLYKLIVHSLVLNINIC